MLVVPLKLALERVVKLLVQRERPGTTVPDAVLRGVHPAGLSFVSGHAIITFAIAGLLALVLPRRWAVVAFVLATLNAVARVYLGAHNPLDVVGGAAVGLAIAAVLDLVLDVARDRGGSRPGQAAPTGGPGCLSWKQGPAPRPAWLPAGSTRPAPAQPPLGWRTAGGPGSGGVASWLIGRGCRYWGAPAAGWAPWVGVVHAWRRHHT